MDKNEKEVKYDDFDDAHRKRMINEIDKSSKSTYELLENLLTWSRSQSGKIAINKEHIKIKELITSCINPYLPNAKAKNISIIEDVDNNISFYADKYTFSNIIGNLLNNAIKFTHVGGEIKISITETNTHQQLIVEDNGIGIGQNDLDKLFRIDESHSKPGTNNERGTGLGLLLCKEFIEMNNGTIEVESIIAKGSRFTIKLPKIN
ncbi:MAG: HAMP domain-containing histidine kinase, partial [Bacteroidetes bacterium]|nr:HAMP domain-containing histidine kinase [Bacteroidota bacterium]